MNIFDKIATWAAYLYIRTGIMRLWSRLHAWIWERNKQKELSAYADLEDLVWTIRSLKWTADTWRELWDAVSSIGHIQWRIHNDPKGMIGDCDEFGRYSACVIRNELRRDSNWSQRGIDTSYFLTVMWKKTGGREWESNRNGYGGHNVCLIKYLDGTWAYMDYGMPSSSQNTVAEVVKQVRDRYAQEYQPLGFAYANPDTLQVVGISRE